MGTGILKDMTTKIKILLVDDQQIVRRGLRMSLGLEGDIHIIGEACDGLEAIELAKKLAPDVILMDVEIPHMDGITATQTLKTITPDTNVVVLTLHDDADVKLRTLDAGAFAFVPKHAPLDALIFTIRQAATSKDEPT